ncbi:hypothetical protein [Streptomyces griseorubiginosus]
MGVIGASVGWNLSRHGAEVVFIDEASRAKASPAGLSRGSTRAT